MKKRTSSLAGLPTAALIAVIEAYRRFISPLFAPNCRFHPTCSKYAIEALRVHGLIRGGWLTCSRLVRCHPFHPGGSDPVPRNGRRKERENGSKDSASHRIDGRRDVYLPDVFGTITRPAGGAG